MTRFGPCIDPITSPTPGRCTTSYATDAGFIITTLPFYILFITKHILFPDISGIFLYCTFLYIVVCHIKYCHNLSHIYIQCIDIRKGQASNYSSKQIQTVYIGLLPIYFDDYIILTRIWFFFYIYNNLHALWSQIKTKISLLKKSK